MDTPTNGDPAWPFLDDANETRGVQEFHVIRTARDGESAFATASGCDVCVVAPSPRFTVTVDQTEGQAPEVHFHAGGQGFWVAHLVAELGGRVHLVGPLGGESGLILQVLIEEAGVSVRSITAAGANGGYVHDRRTGERDVVVEIESPPLTRHEADDLYNVALAEGLSAGVTVLTGTAAPALLPIDFFKRLAKDLSENGARVVADLSASDLRSLEGGITLLKVSREELLRDGLASDDTLEVMLPAVQRLRDRTAANVLLSRAERPAIALLGESFFELVGPRFTPKDYRGAGDSMTAALAVGLARGSSIEESLRLAVPAGALNVTRRGLGSGRRASIEQLAPRVTLTPLVFPQR